MTSSSLTVATEHRSRLKMFPANRLPIVATGFNKDGTLFAYASSYDWNQGHEHFDRSIPNSLKIHVVKEAEIKPKTGGGGRR